VSCPVAGAGAEEVYAKWKLMTQHLVVHQSLFRDYIDRHYHTGLSTL
jgi:hypothetical protein